MALTSQRLNSIHLHFQSFSFPNTTFDQDLSWADLALAADIQAIDSVRFPPLGSSREIRDLPSLNKLSLVTFEPMRSPIREHGPVLATHDEAIYGQVKGLLRLFSFFLHQS